MAAQRDRRHDRDARAVQAAGHQRPGAAPTSLGPTSLAEQAVLNSLAGTLDPGIDYPLPTANSMPSQETSPKRPPVP